MPNTPCPKCTDVGHVRVEHVIHGGKSYRSLECQPCGHKWNILETGEHVPSSERPDRSRTYGPLTADADQRISTPHPPSRRRR